MIIINPNEKPGHITPPPYVRELKLLVSPLLQENVDSISLGLTILQPGCKSSSHIHESETETWVVMEGKGSVIIDDKQIDVQQGMIVVISPNESHQLDNTSNDIFKILWIYTPPGPESAVMNKVHY